jgi:hypothetical protein
LNSEPAGAEIRMIGLEQKYSYSKVKHSCVSVFSLDKADLANLLYLTPTVLLQ